MKLGQKAYFLPEMSRSDFIVISFASYFETAAFVSGKISRHVPSVVLRAGKTPRVVE
jgi:hypothetical protein